MKTAAERATRRWRAYSGGLAGRQPRYSAFFACIQESGKAGHVWQVAHQNVERPACTSREM